MSSSFGGPLDLKLIQLVKDNPLIYNPSHPKYSDTESREQAWQKIGDALHRPARRCKLRWANIRDMMRKKVRDRLRYPEQHFKNYRYEEEVSFMIPFFKEGYSANDYYSDSIFEDSTEVEMPTEVFVNDTLNLDEDDVEVKPILTFRKRKCDASSSCDLQSASCQELNTSDPVDVFLMTIGSTLRKFSPYYLNQAKSKIFQTVQDYELEQLMKENQMPGSSGTSR